MEKAKFNSIYGMCVTNNIRDEVIFDNNLGWDEKELTNEKIIAELENEYKRPFLSYAYGIYVTAYARRNLIQNLIALDEYCLYR